MTMGITSPTSTTGQILKNGSAVISFDSNNNASFAGNVAPLYNPTMRNRIINGAMVIDQRNAGAAIASLVSGVSYLCDRWAYYADVSGNFKYQQNLNSVSLPSGFTNYLGVQQLSAPSSGVVVVQQAIEGYNFADLGFGTANAKTITLSFWVYSSLTGTFGGAFKNYAQTRTYPFQYTISSANTWTQISITIPGDTSGTWVGASNAGSAVLIFGLYGTSAYLGTANAWTASNVFGVTGQVQVGSNSSATFYITGVQLEAGSVATPFEQRLYGTELNLCYRYYQKIGGGDFQAFGAGSQNTTTYSNIFVPFIIPMRATPTFAAGGSHSIVNSSTYNKTVSNYGFGYASATGCLLQPTHAAIGAAGYGVVLMSNGDVTSYISFIAEL